jgi:hypothetical protein
MSDHSAILHRFRVLAQTLLHDREALLALVDEIVSYADEFQSECAAIGDELHCLARLLRAWALGEYDETPVHTLVGLTAVGLYIALLLGGGPPGWFGKVVSLGIELVVLKAIFRKVKRELDAYRTWERRMSGERPQILLVWSITD